jgi:signal transduction histidine kinase
MLLCASLIHFAMVLPNRDSQVIYSQGRIALIYLIPYPLYFCYVMLSYTPDMLTWLRRWELGAIGLVFLAFIVTMFALLRGYRRATTPKQREVVRVVVGGFGVAILIATLLGVAPMLTTGRLALDWQIVPLLSLPVALGFGIAVVFYGLFDIRIVIQRTLVWGTLTALIVVVYVLVVGALSSVFQTRSSPVFSLIATGIVAILFASVRARLQHSVNWMLYGERDNPYQVITQLSHRLEQSLSPNEALTQIVTSVATALKLPYAAVELCQNGQYTHMASWGKAVDECIEYPLTYGGETVGRLLVAPRSPGEMLTNGDHQLLTGLLYHAEAVIQAARLTADLQRSRENLVLTREEERRRLHRDLHDGLGPTLASLRLQVDTARNILKGNPAEVDPMLVDIKTQLGDALADIRRLINDLRPPALDQLGLCTAIREKARELGQASGLRITVEIPSNLPTLSAAAEVALYRICMEALTNVIKHAGATACVVRLSSNHSLKLEVIDNGHGLPEVVQRGVGLNSMMERASELGGSCVIEPGEDGGTRVFAQLPLIKLINQEEH